MTGVKTNEREGTRAVLRHSRMSASKARQVLDQIRGMDADRAAETLRLGDREAATVIGKVLASAVANAVHNDGLDAEQLFVSACYADEGSTLKRWRPRARGRATRIRKRTCHITIIVSPMSEERLVRRRAKQGAAGAQRSRRVAGSRRSRAEEQAPGTTSADSAAESPVAEASTGAEAWADDVAGADDIVTETEAGPLEDPELHEAPEDDIVTETEAGPIEASDLETGEADDGASGTDDHDDESDGDPAEEKGE